MLKHLVSAFVLNNILLIKFLAILLACIALTGHNALVEAFGNQYSNAPEISTIQPETIVFAEPMESTIQPMDTVEPIEVPKPVISGNKQDWMRAAGIPEAEWAYVDYIVSHESGWRPDAVNSSSGACGLVQALPCSKLGPNWSGNYPL